MAKEWTDACLPAWRNLEQAVVLGTRPTLIDPGCPEEGAPPAGPAQTDRSCDYGGRCPRGQRKQLPLYFSLPSLAVLLEE